MDAAVRWFWNNIFMIGIIAIEGSLCMARPRRKGAMLKWLGFTCILLAASSMLTRAWQWEGDLIRRDNLIANTVWRTLLVYLSSAQLCFCFDMDLWNALFITQAAAACQTAQFSAYKLLEVILLGAQAQRAPGLASMVMNLVMLAVSSALIYHIFGRGNKLAFRADGRNRYVILLAAILNLSDMVLNGVLYITDANANFGATMVAMRCYSILFNFVTLNLLYNLIIRRNAEREQDMLRNLVRTRENQYRFSKELINSINVKSHDLKKQISYLKKTASSQDDFLSEIEQIANAYDATIRTENAALSAVLTEKSLYCLEKRIPFSFTGDGKGIGFMRGIDIYTLFANLLDNAIEASLLLEEEERNLQLIMKQQFDFVSIHCSNTFSGQIQEQNGTLQTIKADITAHGFGYRSMEEIAARYDGSISHRAEGKTFIVNILLPCGESE